MTAVKGLDHHLKGDYLAVALEEYKDSMKTGHSTKRHDPRMLLERFQLVANERHIFAKRGNILALIISCCLLMVSYSFVFQPRYDPPKSEIETEQEAYEIDIHNSHLIKADDGTYILHMQNKDIPITKDIPISEELAKMLIEDGFTVVMGSED